MSFDKRVFKEGALCAGISWVKDSLAKNALQMAEAGNYPRITDGNR